MPETTYKNYTVVYSLLKQAVWLNISVSHITVVTTAASCCHRKEATSVIRISVP